MHGDQCGASHQVKPSVCYHSASETQKFATSFSTYLLGGVSRVTRRMDLGSREK